MHSTILSPIIGTNLKAWPLPPVATKREPEYEGWYVISQSPVGVSEYQQMRVCEKARVERAWKGVEGGNRVERKERKAVTASWGSGCEARGAEGLVRGSETV